MMNKIRNLLSLSSSERKGVIALIIIIAIITGIQAYMSFHSTRDIKITDSLWIRELAMFETQLTAGEESKAEEPQVMPAEEYEVPELFNFDPNTVSAVDLKRMGVNSRVIRTLVNFRIKGGKFYKAEDLNKIYGMSQELYGRLAPHIRIPEMVKPEKKMASDTRDVMLNDINLADSSVFEGMRGIGPVLSQRIVRYRSLLGGFYNSHQLMEVYGLDDSVVVSVSRYFKVDTSAITRLNLNRATEQELARHPYIGKFTARGIIKYRTKVQTINSTKELVINGLVTEEEFKRLKHYLGV